MGKKFIRRKRKEIFFNFNLLRRNLNNREKEKLIIFYNKHKNTFKGLQTNLFELNKKFDLLECEWKIFQKNLFLDEEMNQHNNHNINNNNNFNKQNNNLKHNNEKNDNFFLNNEEINELKFNNLNSNNILDYINKKEKVNNNIIPLNYKKFIEKNNENKRNKKENLDDSDDFDLSKNIEEIKKIFNN